jgi:hypothetical protein
LPVADWFAALPVSSMTFDPVEHVVADMTAAGEWLTDDVAPMLWEGSVTLGRMLQAEADHAAVMMDLLRPAGRLFWCYDIRRPTPAADPGGVLLGAATPLIHALPSGNRTLALSGLPPGYVLRRGDYLGFAYAGRRALHRIAEAQVVANGSGITPAFELSTLILPGAAVGAPVTLIRPAIPVMREPGSVVTGETRARITEGFTFRFKQTLAVLS